MAPGMTSNGAKNLGKVDKAPNLADDEGVFKEGGDPYALGDTGESPVNYESKNSKVVPESGHKGVKIGSMNKGKGRWNKSVRGLSTRRQDVMNSLIKTQTQEGVKEAQKMLEKAEMDYQKGTLKKWGVFTIGLFLGIVLGLGVPQLSSMLSTSLYDRRAIEGLMDELIGQQNISAAMFDEMLLVAYEYNSQQPRFYSKYFSKLQPGIYDIKMSLATGGSSAAPVFFEPQQSYDHY